VEVPGGGVVCGPGGGWGGAGAADAVAKMSDANIKRST
jgi:hypothetical protein